MIKRKYAYMRIYDNNIDFEDVENTITYSLSAKNLENNLNKREEKLCNKITNLEAKLAEKEKEAEYQESMKILAVKNQNQTAIAELEKALNNINHNTNCTNEGCVPYDEIEEIIDQQIAELKGEKR